MKHFFVINPHSFIATEGYQNVIAEIESCFVDGNSDDFRIHISRYTRDAIAVVHDYISSYSTDELVRIYAIGGDGILFECLNGMVDFPNAELTSIPYGNANDFVRAFGEDAYHHFRDIKNLLCAPSRPVDIIHCGSNYALNGVNIGLVGQTIIEAFKVFPHLSAKWLRKNISFAYTLCALKGLVNKALTSQYYTATVDGRDYSGKYCNIYIANHSCIGGDMTPSPYAIPNDGKLNVIFAKSLGTLSLAQKLGEYNKGKFEKFDFLFHSECNTMEIKSDRMLCVEMDGEGFYAHELVVKIIPNGVRVFAPQGLDFVDYSYKAYRKSRLK